MHALDGITTAPRHGDERFTMSICCALCPGEVDPQIWTGGAFMLAPRSNEPLAWVILSFFMEDNPLRMAKPSLSIGLNRFAVGGGRCSRRERF